MSSTERRIDRVITTPAPSPGFIGEGHTASMVVDPNDFARNDPFIALMDDHVDLAPGKTAGGAHPHAGFETVTFVLEGRVRDRDEGTLETGDLLWMTAGSGVIHNEEVVPDGYTRILQLWLTLPHEHRWAAPRFEHVVAATLPVRREPGVVARVYSGNSGGLTAPTFNYVPVTLVDVTLDAGATFEQDVPASYNGFVYVLDGDLEVGAERTAVTSGQVAWLGDPSSSSGDAVLQLTAGAGGARALIYAGERQGVPIVMHGPFVGETRDDLLRISRDYMAGKLPKLSEIE